MYYKCSRLILEKIRYKNFTNSKASNVSNAFGVFAFNTVRNMKTIYKFVLELKDFQIINIAYDAEILSVQAQENKLCLWAIVPTDHEKINRFIEIVGTGNMMVIGERKFISTVQLGGCVWHIFEKIS